MRRIIALSAVLATVLSAVENGARAVDADYRLWEEIEKVQKIAGPLVGHVTDSTALVWAYAGPNAKTLMLELEETRSPGAETNGRELLRQRHEIAPDPSRHHRVQFELTGLAPRTRYAFRVSSPGDPAAVETGSFVTAPAPGKPAAFRMAVASCTGGAYRREDDRTRIIRGYASDSWRLLMDQHPDLQLLIGDNVYADSTDYNHLWDSHVLERVNNGPFGQSIRSMPTYAVWDDHDYGPNNSDGRALGKEGSLQAFHEVFANPPRRGGDGPGIYTQFSWGGVDFFLLDCRYHRSPNEERSSEKKTILGDEQFDWLIEQLKASNAPFKLLVDGSTWDASRSDGWRIFPHERRKLWNALVENRIEGVVFVSGDVHRCDLPLHPPEVEHAYFMPEIISSGLGSHGKYDQLAFVIVDFDLTRNNPLMTARIIDGAGLETQVRRVRASELRIRD